MAGSTRERRDDARVMRSAAAMRQALLVLLERMPLDDITGAMIAKQAKVGYATFFRHYTDMRALLVDAVAAITDELAKEMMPALLAADSGRAASVLIDAVAARRAVFRALLSGAGAALRAELARQVIERVAMLPDLSQSWLPRRLALRIAVIGTIELLDWWLIEEPDRDPVEVAALLHRIVASPIANG